MDIKQLRYFIAIVEQGSFSRAASILNVAQPALSIHLRNMEKALDTPLLLRGPQGVVATEAGMLLAGRARIILAELARTEEEIRSLGSEPAGEVRLGLPGTISGVISVPLITAARRKYPKVKINIAEAMSGFVSEWLMDGRVDLAVLYHDIRQKGVVSQLLLKEELVMLSSPAEKTIGSVELADISDLSMILPSPAHGLRRMLDHAARQVGVKLSAEIEIDSYRNIKSLVAYGAGHSILPFHAVAKEAAAGEISIRHFAAPHLWREAYLVNLNTRPLTRAAQAIADLLRDTVTDMLADGSWALDGLGTVATEAGG